MPGNLGNFQKKTWKFTKFPGIWDISQMSGNLGNSLNSWESGKLPKYLGIWGIPQIP